MELSKMTVKEIEEVLRYWENTIDGCKWNDEDRQLTIDAVTESKMTLQEWKDYLIKVPDDVSVRYRKIMKMIADKKLITQEAYEYEMKVMNQFSPAMLTRRGQSFAKWFREVEARGFA